MREANDLPILEYLANIGLIITDENVTTTPLMVYYDDSVKPVALGFYTLFEDGSLLSGGEMPVGTSFAAVSYTHLDVYKRQRLSHLPAFSYHVRLFP